MVGFGLLGGGGGIRDIGGGGWGGYDGVVAGLVVLVASPALVTGRGGRKRSLNNRQYEEGNTRWAGLLVGSWCVV